MNRAVSILAIAAMLTGCQAFGERQEIPAGVVVRTEKVEVVRKVYVPIDADLLKRCAWTKGVKPSAALTELVIRKGCLEQYERQLQTISGIQGRAK
ncbi:hypothetical protein V3390_09235 [Luteimonas sp. FXH3W]|uniref:O-spanin n=1 Tax=Aquilutibacter rugosus TaxID=3115820 RepID=A0ABU7V1I8_9GAMM